MINDDAKCISHNEVLFYPYAQELTQTSKLSLEEFGKLTGRENSSEKTAEKIIEGLYQLSLIIYKIYNDVNRPF